MERGSGEDGMKQPQDQGSRRPKLADSQMPPNQPQPPAPPPQKCPRCDSINTKFCYYNNYSLSQPRYFCKTCRRYWTQGGTLRNVPVGGGCRKGKRPKTSSSSSGENSRSLPNLQLPLPPLPGNQQQLQLPPHMTSMAAMVSSISGLPTTSQSLRNLPWGHAPTSSLYPSGGLLSSLAAMQSLSRPQGINQPIHLGGIGSSSGANLPIFQGFDFSSSMKSQQVQTLQTHQSAGFQGMVDQEKDGEPFYPTDQNLGQPTRTLNSWNHGENDTNPSSSNPNNFWNNSSSSTSSGMAGSSANTNQWPNLPGFGASP